MKEPATELKSAAQLYWLYSFSIALPMVIVIALSGKPSDPVSVTICSCFTFYILLLVLAGYLLFKRRKAGLFLGWILMPLILLAFPIGTALGVFIITKITRPDVRALFI
jgi:hypothetical protein